MTDLVISCHNHAGGELVTRQMVSGITRALSSGVDVLCFLAHNSSEPFDRFRARAKETSSELSISEVGTDGLWIRHRTGAELLLVRGNELSTSDGEIVAIGAIGEILHRLDGRGEPTSVAPRHGEPRRWLDLETILDLNHQLSSPDVVLFAPHPFERRTGLASPSRGPGLLSHLLHTGVLDTFERFNGAAEAVSWLGYPDVNRQAAVYERSVARQGIAVSDSSFLDVTRCTTTVRVRSGLSVNELIPALKVALREDAIVGRRMRPLPPHSLLVRAMMSRRNPLVRALGTLLSR